MAKQIYPGSMIKIPGIPDEDENKSEGQRVLESMYPATPPLSTDPEALAARQTYKAKQVISSDDEQSQGEQALQQLANTPPAQLQPEDAMTAYQRLSKQAEEATPSEEDVLAANIRRVGAQMRAEAPAYLEKAAETLFYKPDYSQITRAAEGEAKQPDMILSAKQQSQKRLETLAEGARKRALLPGQMKEQEAQVAEADARMQALKLKADAASPAASGDIQKFMDVYGKKYGVSVPDNVTKGELADYYAQGIKGAFGIAEAKERAKLRGEGSPIQTERESRLKNKEVNTMVTTLRNQYNKEVESSKKGLEAAERIEQFADSKNWALLAAIGPQLAKGIGGDVGALSNKDIARYDANPQLLTKYKDMIKKALTGEITDATAQEYKDAGKIVKGILQDKLAKKQQKYRTILTKNKLYTELGGDEDYANEQLFGGELFSGPTKENTVPTSKQASVKILPSEMVDVVAPNGQRGRIPKDKLDAARKKGFKLLGE